jgi:acetophenone carboxylase
MGRRVTITEYLDLDVDESMWYCSACNRALIDAEENYKKGCLVYKRDPREIHNAVYEAEFNFAPDPDWVNILEFYCPGCGVQVETEYLPPGHPITHDIDIDVVGLKARIESGQLAIVDKKLEVRS